MVSRSSAEAQQFTQQGPKLVGSGAVGYAAQGSSVALSADGNTALVGGPDDGAVLIQTGGETGAVWVFTRDADGNWTQQGNKLVGSGAVGDALQGSSVALSADGNTALVGGPEDGIVGAVGAVWVFTRDANGNWSQQGNKLVGTAAGNVGGALGQGASVALSADGNTALVGSPGDNEGTGAVWFFTRDANGNWTQQGNKLVGTGAAGDYGAVQGLSVALSADGNTALVGGPGDDAHLGVGVGAVWVFTRDANGNWSQQGNKLVGSGAVGYGAEYADQGSSVALSADGNTAVVGGPEDGAAGAVAGVGAVWVFTRDANGNWTQQGNKLVGTGAAGGHANQGSSVALSADGNTTLVGGPGDDAVGAVWVFTRDANGNWTQQGNKLVGSGAVGDALQGSSVALSADGNTALIGAYEDNRQDLDHLTLTGAAWVFTRPSCPVFVNLDFSGQNLQYMVASFTPPNPNTSILGYASSCGFKNFNWQQVFSVLPVGSSLTPELPSLLPNNVYPASCSGVDSPLWPGSGCFMVAGPASLTGNSSDYPNFSDPPNGGYVPAPGRVVFNPYPFYYYQSATITPGESCTLPGNCPPFPTVLSPDGTTLSFVDDPTMHSLVGDTPSTTPVPGHFVAFKTSLVGVDGQGNGHPLCSWTWNSTYNGNIGGVTVMNMPTCIGSEPASDARTRLR